ncbi:MAG TPA: DUF2243 domain-containing protein [Labilithrix sp.]|nr:DUF2243 domain-containing protein [Labilithrix sp.]
MLHGDRLLIRSGVLLGIGLGGFVDGIGLHQILQWHGMVSSVVPPVTLVTAKVNMLWDGVFHALMWLATAAGVFFLARAASAERKLDVGRTLIACMLLGWGMFNIVEGLIDHQLLGLHHVHPGENQLAWDLGYLIFSAILVVIGARLLVRTVRPGHLEPAPSS